MSQDTKEIKCPSIVFKVKNGYFAINSKNIQGISQLPAVQKLPNPPPNIVGMFMNRGRPLMLMDMRGVFGMTTVQAEFDAFSQMIEQRKQDHMMWIETLKEAVATGEEFPLSTDPHQCAFGIWYDRFTTENETLRTHLRKIEEPHALLHQSAAKISEYRAENADGSKDALIQETLEQAEKKLAPKILALMDETVEMYRYAVFHEMVLVLSDGTIDKEVGMIVDEVLSVEDLSDMSADSNMDFYNAERLVASVAKSARYEDIILVLDENKIYELLAGY